jgi:hypothetical protein
MMQRDMSLLFSADHGGHFTEVLSHPWAVSMCPMSSAGFAEDVKQGTWAAWETGGRIYFTRFSGAGSQPAARPVGPAKGAKHPRLATNARGEVLVVWTEGTGWQRGGALAWQVFDANGEPTAEKGTRDGIPTWSYAAPFARPNGEFAILY